MNQRKIEGIKIIANAYKVVKPLFQIKSYLYAQVCCLKNNYRIANTALYVYENEDPSQVLKMLSQKLDIQDKSDHSNLIFPYHHVKDTFNDKNISLFFIKDYLVPFRYYEKKSLSIPQALQILHGALSCLNHLHLREIVHGNISLSTSYLVKQHKQENCKFAFNILDTAYFTDEDSVQTVDERLFQSEGRSLGLKASYKDDLESLVYVITHMMAKGKMFTVQRFQLQWVTEAQFFRWKSCDFFKQMITIIPPELEILIEIYTIAKSLRRDEKADYIKLMKKVLGIMSVRNNKGVKAQQEKMQQSRAHKVNSRSKEPINQADIIVKINNMKQKGPDLQDRIKENQSTFLQTKREEVY